MDVVALSLSSSEEHLRAWHRLGVDFWREEMPGVDPIGELEARADLESDLTMSRHALLGIEDGDVVGAVAYELPQLEDLDVAWVNILVDPRHRRRGLGTALLAALTDAVVAEGRSRLVGDARLGGPGEGFAAAAGARVTQTDVGSVLDVSTTDCGSLYRLGRPGSGYTVLQC